MYRLKSATRGGCPLGQRIVNRLGISGADHLGERLKRGLALALGRSGPNLTPGTVCVCGTSGLKNGMNTT